MREFIKQPPKTFICGQIALAHLLGITLDDAVALIGHRHGTETRDMIRALHRAGWYCGTRLERWRYSGHLLSHALLKVADPNSSRWHWVAYIDGVVWDGMTGSAPGLYNWKNWRITSALIVASPRL